MIKNLNIYLKRNIYAQDFRSSQELTSGAFHKGNAETGHTHRVPLALIHTLCGCNG